MKLQQFKYAVEIANKSSFSEAARSLFISQPSLSNAIKELEEEINLSIFIRTHKGVSVTKEGAEFLSHARQMLEHYQLMEEKYLHSKPAKQHFSVSTQHYTFAINAFVNLIKDYGADEYEFTIRETKTYDIIEDIRSLRSEIGVLYINTFNARIILKHLRENDLVFSELFTARPHIFISTQNPLAQRTSVTIEDLEEYPYLSFEQGDNNSFYFSEEILSNLERKKSIKVTDRAAIVNLLIGLNAYTISTGIIGEEIHGDDFIAIPLEVEEEIQIGTIRHKNMNLSRLGEQYLEELQRMVKDLV
ncbi:LysR family transcriptional regulator [Paenibacillus sp. GCM10012306]|uniref:LysR family transcriptional regulator n=1 Tax=Paenibacillus sp. GCM10012306 TaxID=3317342 RepID=UPI003620C19F